MAFKQFTRCIEAAKFNPNRVGVIIGYGAIAGGTALGIVALSGRWDCWPLIAEITAMAMVVGYCENWLFARLICLGGDVDCIAVIASISPPSPDLIFSSGDDVFDLDWDTDYSINLLLENCEFGISQADAEQTLPYGNLIAPQAAVTNIGLETPGHKAFDEASGTTSAILHAEFEGAGNHTLLQAADAALGLAIAALFACIILPFPVGLILGLLSLLALILGALLGNNDFGSPSDAGGGELHTNTIDPDSGQAVGADVLYVQGTWVYDTLHEGWNEIHPIKVCTKIGCWKGDWGDIKCGEEGDPAPPDIILLRVRKGFQEAQAPETLANQALPENQWRFHPDLDGCASDIIV
jgi:hypothetical protein